MKSDDKSEQDFVLDPTSQKLYEALRDWRTEVYTKINKPAYIVMANKVIKQIAYHKPTSKDELLTIRGIGQAKLHQYGDEIIAIVSTFLDN